MSQRDLSFKGTHWLGDVCQKIEKMCHDVDQMMIQDTVGYAKSQIQTVGKNVKKLGSNVMHDLPFPDFVASKANSALSLGPNCVIKPKTNAKVTDIEGHGDAITEKLAVREFENSSPEGFSSTSTDLLSILKDDHWENENLETNRVHDLKVGKLAPSEGPELTCSDEDDPSGSCPESSSTNMVQEAEDDTKEMVLSSSEGSESVHADTEYTVESLSKSAFINKIEQDANNLFRRSYFPSTADCPSTTDGSLTTDGSSSGLSEIVPKSASINKAEEDANILLSRIPFPSTTDAPLSGLPRQAYLIAGPVQEYDSDIASARFCSEQEFPVASCENESTNNGLVPSRSSLLSESLDLVEVSVPDLHKNRCDVSHSSTSTLAWDFAGDPNASIISIKDLLMETIDLSDKVELDRSCIMAEKEPNHSFSKRRGYFNKYKAKLQNSLSSKKRLEKDYKLLAIQHGDIDADFRQLTQRNKTVVSTVRDDLKKISPAQDVEDVEWEII